MDCTKCHQKNELAKGKRWCKICKNKYEVERRNKHREEIRKKERERYYEKKEKLKDVMIEIDSTKNKTCSVCNETKTLDNFFIAKCKGNIRAMCKKCSSDKRKEHYINNKTAIIKQTNNYKVEKMKRDPIFKLEQRLRIRIYQAFTSQNLNKNNRTWKYINCSPYFFQKWIEFQLYDGMTLENYGKIWHIDHVIPCASFDLSNDIEVRKCFEWKNLRPYLAHKNKTKSDKINNFDIIMQELKVFSFQKLLK